MVAKYTLILTSVLVGGAAAQGGAFTMNYNGADRKTDGKWSHRTGDQYDLTADPRKDMIMTCGEVKIYAGGISDDEVSVASYSKEYYCPDSSFTYWTDKDLCEERWHGLPWVKASGQVQGHMLTNPATNPACKDVNVIEWVIGSYNLTAEWREYC